MVPRSCHMPSRCWNCPGGVALVHVDVMHAEPTHVGRAEVELGCREPIAFPAHSMRYRRDPINRRNLSPVEAPHPRLSRLYPARPRRVAHQPCHPTDSSDLGGDKLTSFLQLAFRQPCASPDGYARLEYPDCFSRRPLAIKTIRAAAFLFRFWINQTCVAPGDNFVP